LAVSYPLITVSPDGAAENMIQELGGPMLGMLVSFFAGSLAAGVASRSKESKSLLTLSWCLLVRIHQRPFPQAPSENCVAKPRSGDTCARGGSVPTPR
jgi:hypothetical protein